MKNETVIDEIVCIVVLGIVATFSIFYLKSDASNIVSAIGGGLVGYLKGSSK